jgi:hypothetical protein
MLERNAVMPLEHFCCLRVGKEWGGTGLVNRVDKGVHCFSHRSAHALYQGTTLVGPKTACKLLGFSPCSNAGADFVD